MFKKLLALLLIPSLAFGQAASSVIAEKPIIQGATGVQVVVTGTGEIRLVTSADTTAKGFYLDSSTGSLTSVGSAGIGSATSALGTIFANIVQASTGSNLDLKARNGSVRMFAIGSDSTPVETWRFSSDGTLTQEASNGGNIVFAKNSSAVIRRSADNDVLSLLGSSTRSTTNGAYIDLFGTSGAPGDARIYAGNVSGGSIDLATGNAVNRISLLDTGSIVLDRTNTAGGTTGAQTINKMAGSVNFAAAATSLVVTNSLVAATSNIFCQVQTNDATFTSVKSCVPGSGSFTINANAAATAETRVAFWVTN